MTLAPEPRWPPALAILAQLALAVLLPGHLRLLPVWGAYLAAGIALVPLVGVSLAGPTRFWMRAETVTITTVAPLLLASQALTLATLIRQIADGSTQATGMELLTSSTVVWTVVVVGFALLYWQVDGGGPAARQDRETRLQDWSFAQDTSSQTRPGWRPSFADYLFLAFSTSTAFSTTDTIPLTGRAKLLMMAQASMSLITMVVIASRAINVLGS